MEWNWKLLRAGEMVKIWSTAAVQFLCGITVPAHTVVSPVHQALIPAAAAAADCHIPCMLRCTDVPSFTPVLSAQKDLHFNKHCNISLNTRFHKTLQHLK